MSLNPTLAAKEREGSTLNGKYTIDRLLGVGGMAAVYAATHRNKKRCALKILHTELSAKPEIRERFLREGYVANTVDHPGAVKVDDDDTSEDGSAYLVMELLEGKTLEGVACEAGGKLAPQVVLPLMDQLLAVLAAAHDKGIVHRDIKPENVFLHRGVQVKVLDFGIARLQEADGGTRRTVDGAVMGTPAFMAPEQARGVWAEVDGQSDIWSVGASMFSMLSGEVVHTGSTINEALAAAIIQPARPIRDLLPDLPPPIANVVDTALKRDKFERYKTANDMRQALNVAHRAVYGADLPQAFPAFGVPDDLYRESMTSNPSAPGLGASDGAVPGTTGAASQGSLWSASGGETTPPVTATHTSQHGTSKPVLLAVALTILGGIVLVGGVGLYNSMSGQAEREPAARSKAAHGKALGVKDTVARAPEPIVVPVAQPQASPSADVEATQAKEPKPAAPAPKPRATKGPTKRPKVAKPSVRTPTKAQTTPEAPPAKKFDPFASRD